MKQKNRAMIFLNILIIAVVFFMLWMYYRIDSHQSILETEQNFNETASAMAHVSENCLEKYQSICDNWAAYIGAHSLPMQEALDYILQANADEAIEVHLVWTDDYQGVSTAGRLSNPDDHAVDYSKLTTTGSGLVLDDALEELSQTGEEITIHATRAYTNPLSGKKVVSFYRDITLQEDGQDREALLLCVVSVSLLQEDFIFPQGDFENAMMAVIDQESGYYIIGHNELKNTSFYEFIREYNGLDYTAVENLKTELAEQDDYTAVYRNASGKKVYYCLIEMDNIIGWEIVAFISEEELSLAGQPFNWTPVMIIAISLLLLLVVDILFFTRISTHLELAAKEADQASKAKTMFLSTMSHDIRTPMNAIMGMTRIAMRNAGDEQQVRACLHKITISSNHLLTLINDILDISKIESGQLRLAPTTFSIAREIETLVSIMQPKISEKQLDFDFAAENIHSELLYGDSLRLNQILINLLSNAVKYTNSGGRVRCLLKMSPEREDHTVVLTYQVADNGIGMTEEFLAKMYAPFSRAEDGRISTVQGTGLGLAITKSMVDLMGGTIQCESQIGKGTTFIVEIPFLLKGEESEEKKLPRVRILLIDDDQDFALASKEVFESLELQVDMAFNREEVLAKTQAAKDEGNEYGLFICDWKMQGERDGALAAMLQQQYEDRVPVIVSSAYEWTEIEEIAGKSGLRYYLGKPFFKSTVYDKLAETLLQKQQNGQMQEDEQEQSLDGMRLLIAEDNDMNWEIISELLDFYDISCERAENGQVCVEKMESCDNGRYDAVLMDVQMPVMNGLEAARRIRASQSEYVRSIPIVAMTADAFAENIQECLDAGMNGHLSKPIDMQRVLQTLKRIKYKEHTAGQNFV